MYCMYTVHSICILCNVLIVFKDHFYKTQKSGNEPKQKVQISVKDDVAVFQVSCVCVEQRQREDEALCKMKPAFIFNLMYFWIIVLFLRWWKLAIKLIGLLLLWQYSKCWVISLIYTIIIYIVVVKSIIWSHGPTTPAINTAPYVRVGHKTAFYL